MSNMSSSHGGKIWEHAISSGTLKADDLLRTFADEIERVLPFNGSRLANEAREAADGDDAELQHELLNECFAQLEDIAAREGWLYFGTLEGDGACFGYWRIEDEEM